MAEGKTTVRIRQVRSGIGFPEKQKKVLRGLGFRRLQQVVEHPDNEAPDHQFVRNFHTLSILDRRASG